MRPLDIELTHHEVAALDRPHLPSSPAYFDVTVGDNGEYTGPGRDQTTGFGVVDFGRLLNVLIFGTQVPAPGGNGGTTAPTSSEVPGSTALLRGISSEINNLLGTK